MPEIEITINEDGTVEIDGKGFNGKGCHEALGAYLKAIGREKTSKKKAEFYTQKQKATQQAKIRGS